MHFIAIIFRSVPRSNWTIRMVEPSDCPGKNLSMFKLVKESVPLPRVYTLKNANGNCTAAIRIHVELNTSAVICT